MHISHLNLLHRCCAQVITTTVRSRKQRLPQLTETYSVTVRIDLGVPDQAELIARVARRITTEDNICKRVGAIRARQLARRPRHSLVFLLPVMLQVVWGYSPLASGLALLPLTVILLALSARSGKLAARIGPRLPLTVGPATAGAGLAMLTLATSGSGYVLHVLPAVVVLGLGLAITTAPLTSAAMNSAPPQHAGIASAINNDMSRFGGLLAVAVLPALAGITGSAYLQPETLAAGFRTAALISAGLCAAGGLLAAATITNPPRAPRPAGAAAPEECFHCGLDAPPLITSVSQTGGTD